MKSAYEGHIIGVAGFKDTGKTQVVEGLIAYLSGKGYAVGTVKHVHDAPDLEPAGKDSVRHLDAGARATVVIGKDVVEVLSRERADLDQALQKHLGLCDYIVVEGFKHAGIPKIAVVSEAAGSEGEEILKEAGNVVAIVRRGAGSQDRPSGRPADGPETHPAFAFEDIDKLGDFLFEQKVLRKPGRIMSLVVNGKPVRMNEFVRSSLSGVIRGFIASLRDVEQPATVQLTIKDK